MLAARRPSAAPPTATAPVAPLLQSAAAAPALLHCSCRRSPLACASTAVSAADRRSTAVLLATLACVQRWLERHYYSPLRRCRTEKGGCADATAPVAAVAAAAAKRRATGWRVVAPTHSALCAQSAQRVLHARRLPCLPRRGRDARERNARQSRAPQALEAKTGAKKRYFSCLTICSACGRGTSNCEGCA